MKSSDQEFTINISFRPEIKGMHLTLINGNLEVIRDENADQLAVRLFKGVYLLKIKYLYYYQEHFITADEDKTIVLDINYPATAPILSFHTTHEWFSNPAEKYSEEPTWKGGDGNPDFLFFAARYDKDVQTASNPESWRSSYSIFNDANTVRLKFCDENARYDNNEGWMCFSGQFSPGLYFLRYDADKASRIFPFYIYDDFQTQFFLRYDQSPDFKNCIFFYTKKMQFRRSFEEYLVLDKILFAYSNYSKYELINADDFLIIAEHPYLVSLVRILQLTLGVEKPDFENCGLLELPDLQFVKNTEDNLLHLSNTLPVLSFVMNKYLHKGDSSDLLFEPASLLDRTVDFSLLDIFWSSFSEIGEVSNWKNIYSPLLENAPFFPIQSQNGLIVKLGKTLLNTVFKNKQPEITEKINFLLGEKLFSEKSITEINTIINKVNGLSEMSREFGLPPTTILREYKRYKDIYDKLKK